MDDGIAMGHDWMLYSLPSRELVADSVEYMGTSENCPDLTAGIEFKVRWVSGV